MQIAGKCFALFLAAATALVPGSRLLAADQQKGTAQRTVTEPKELLLVEPGAITRRTVGAWKEEGFTGLVAVLDERCEAKVCALAAKEASASGLDMYYWIEVGRSPKLAAEHPEWMASLGMHEDWLKRFPNAKAPGQMEVAKAFPWVPIHYQEAFDAHLERIDRLLKLVPPNYLGIFLNDLQGGPSSCGCGNLQCRWATDYHVSATGTKFENDEAATRFVAAVQEKIDGKELIPVWATECDDEDLSREKRAGEWTTGYSGTVGCAVGRCPKDFTKQWSALTKAHHGRVAILALHRELGRALPEYGQATGWIRHAVEYLDRTLPHNGGQAILHERLCVVVQGYDVSKAEETSARKRAAETGAGLVLVARTRIDQSYEPRIVPVKK